MVHQQETHAGFRPSAERNVVSVKNSRLEVQSLTNTTTPVLPTLNCMVGLCRMPLHLPACCRKPAVCWHSS